MNREGHPRTGSPVDRGEQETHAGQAQDPGGRNGEAEDMLSGEVSDGEGERRQDCAEQRRWSRANAVTIA